MEIWPTSFMPRERKLSPTAENNMMLARTRYLRGLKPCVRMRQALPELYFRPLSRLIPDHLIPHGTKLQEGFRFPIQTFALGTVKGSFLQDAVNSLGPEVVFVVEAVDRAQYLVSRETRILDVR